MELTIVKMPQNKYSIKCPYEMEPEGITVHNTANDASAMAEVSYMIGNNNQVSFHEAVDDYRVVQGVLHNRNTWNSGDGSKGFGNRKTISIEICYSKSGGERFDKAERNAVKRIAQILKEHNWGIEKVGKHQDRNKKYCPHKTLDLGWERFLNMIKEELGYINTPDIQIKAHIQDHGWTDWKNAGETIGTVGEEKRLEAIILQGNNGVDLSYKVHVQDTGWQEWKHSGEVAGTEGESKRIEAIEIQSNKILEVREQVQNIGWMPCSKGTAVKIGTETKGLRLEAFVIDIV